MISIYIGTFCLILLFCYLFFNDTATTEIYTYGHTLSLHDALPISSPCRSERRSNLVPLRIGRPGRSGFAAGTNQPRRRGGAARTRQARLMRFSPFVPPRRPLFEIGRAHV